MRLKEPRSRAVYLEESLIGVFGVNEEGEVVEKAIYPNDPKQIAAALTRQRRGEATREVSEVVEKLLQRGFNYIITTNKLLARTLEGKWGVRAEAMPGTGAGDIIRGGVERLGVEYGLFREPGELLELSHEVTMLMGREAVRAAMSEREALISQGVQLLGDVDTMLNSLSSRLREWYGLHFPELGRIVSDHRTYARLASSLGDRARYGVEELVRQGLDGKEARRVSRAAENSMGASFETNDLEQVRMLAFRTLELYDYRQGLGDYVSSLAEGIAPNLSRLAGAPLAAKLIEKAGGLRRMAMMPSSTIQLLGAEKAMFRAMKTKARPPKHGLIFQHPYVHGAPRGERGSRARALAAKLAIAARADFFSGEFIAPRLEEELGLGPNGDK